MNSARSSGSNESATLLRDSLARGKLLAARDKQLQNQAMSAEEMKKQAAKEADQAAREANKESARNSDVKMARRFLYGEGYKVKTQAGKFRVHEPAGGRTDWKTEEELIEYAKERGCRL